MSHLPETGLLRLVQILGDRKATPPVPALVPIGKTAWWAGVASGKYPKAVKLGGRATFWRASDIRSLIESAR